MINSYMQDQGFDNVAIQLKNANQNLITSINIECDHLKQELTYMKLYLSILDPKFNEVYSFITQNSYMIEEDNSILEAYIRKLKIENINSI